MIIFKDSSEVITFSDTNDSITFTNTHPILVFDVVMPASGGIPLIIPFIIS